MTWEYRQFVINTKGWLDIKLPDNYVHQLNNLANKGWEVNKMVPIHTGISGTSSVVFLLRRPKNSSRQE
jgi:hypothetical protein